MEALVRGDLGFHFPLIDPLFCDRWSDKDFGCGGSFVTVSAGLDEIPVFYLGDKEDILQGTI